MIQTIPSPVETFPALELDARELQAHIRALRNSIELTWLELGAALRKAYEREDWRELRYISFAVYVEDTLRTSKSEAYDLIRIAKIIERYPELTPRVLDAGKANMRAVLPQIENDENAAQVEQWTETAAVNTWRELQAAIREEPMHLRRVKRVEIVCKHCGASDVYEIEI